MKVLRILVLIFGLTVFANAQKTVLSGTVTDQVGAVISKAKIKISGNKNQNFVVETNDEGNYKISLSEGIYSIKFEISGHKSFTIKNYRVSSYGTMKLDVALYANPTPII